MSTEKKVAGEFEGSNGGAFAYTEHLEMQMHFMRMREIVLETEKPCDSQRRPQP